jgi:hypothetical protein
MKTARKTINIFISLALLCPILLFCALDTPIAASENNDTKSGEPSPSIIESNSKDTDVNPDTGVDLFPPLGVLLVATVIIVWRKIRPE